MPLLIPGIPFGFVLGLEMGRSELPTGLAYLTSYTLFAGAGQLALVTLAGATAVITVILTVLVINARHIMYSAAVAPIFSRQPRWFRVLAPMTLIDQIFALSVVRTEDEPAEFRRYYGTLAAMYAPTWAAWTGLGILFGDVIPESLGLSIAPAIMFAGLVVGMVTGRPAAVAALTAAAVTLLMIGLPNRSGLLVGALCGVVAGYLTEGRSDRHNATGTAVE